MQQYINLQMSVNLQMSRLEILLSGFITTLSVVKLEALQMEIQGQIVNSIGTVNTQFNN